MTDTLVFEKFVRSPFVIEATLITEENIDEIAALIGEIQTKDGQKYIRIDRRVIPSMGHAELGWWFTRMNDNYRCYNPKVFSDQFKEVGDADSITIEVQK